MTSPILNFILGQVPIYVW